MVYITPLQCRAARAILNISRNDLADVSGVAASTIGAFETEASQPRGAMVTQLKLALEAQGISFLDEDGVRLRSDDVRVYEGAAIHRQLLDEIYHDLKDTGGEILIKGLAEQKWQAPDDAAFLNTHLDRLMKAGITERLLIAQSDTIYVAPRHWYRKIPDKYFTPHTQWIYGHKVAIITWGDIERLVILDSPAFALAETKLFDCLWHETAELVEA